MTDATASPFSSIAGYPDQVINPAAFNVAYSVSGYSIHLSWAPVTAVLYYDVFVGTTVPDTVQQITELTATSYTIDNLIANNLYYVQVIAYLAPGVAVASAIQQVVVSADDPLLGVTGLVLYGSTGRYLYGYR